MHLGTTLVQDMSILTSNVAKLLLAIESMLFDIAYLVQRFMLYPPRKSVQLQNEMSDEVGYSFWILWS